MDGIGNVVAGADRFFKPDPAVGVAAVFERGQQLQRGYERGDGEQYDGQG